MCRSLHHNHNMSKALRGAPKVSRLAYHWHGVVANPAFTVQHQLSVAAFQHAYKWFPLVKSSWRTGQYELAPERLAAGAQEARALRIAQDRARRTVRTRKKTVKAPQDYAVRALKEAAGPRDLRTHLYVQPAVKELVHGTDNAVPNLATKVTHPGALLEMHPPTKVVGDNDSFDRLYYGVMKYYQEYMTKMFERPVYLVSSFTTEFGLWDASFVAHFLRYRVEDNRQLASAIRDLEYQMNYKSAVRPVRHFDETQHYAVRAWRVYLKGRFHNSPFGLKEEARSFRYGKIPQKQPDKYVDYYQCQAQTSQGILGIKVWIYMDHVE